MDALLGKITQQAVNYAIRSGVTLTASYAIRQSSRLLQSAPNSSAKDEVNSLQLKLQHKVHIISPAIDMIELISARGNTSLASAVALTKELRYQIQELGQRLEKAATANEQHDLRGSKPSPAARQQHEAELRTIAADIKQILQRIEDAVPLINLAITTSGAKLSSQLPSTVSPSRLLQASTLLSTGDFQFQQNPNAAIQVGPTFNLTVYMLFTGHTRPETEEDIRDTTWKEVIHKARLKLRRVPLAVLLHQRSGLEIASNQEIITTQEDRDFEESRIPADTRADEFAYQLMIVEDLDDDRVHDFSDDELKPGPFDDVPLAGIREIIPIHEISKIFYADTSKVLNISPESLDHHPVLLLKRDSNAIPPRRMVEKDDLVAREEPNDQGGFHEIHEQPASSTKKKPTPRNDPWQFPPSLDPEWIAFEVYTEENGSDTESEPDATEQKSSLPTGVSNLSLQPPVTSQPLLQQSYSSPPLSTLAPPVWAKNVQTSLSLLELLLRLTSLQQFQQASHLTISDELLNFFLEESATTGAGGDEAHRQALRADARRRVGWDPYDESPLKRRGEDYQYQQGLTSDQDSRYSVAYSQEGTPLRGKHSIHSPPSGVWSPSPGRGGQDGAQTRSITGFSSDGGYSPSPITKGRADWIRRQEPSGDTRQGSPLRQNLQEQGEGRRSSGRDEGLGTSPASTGVAK